MKRIEQPFAVVERAVASEDVPSAVALFGRPDQWYGPRAFGLAQLDPERPATVDTRYDLASVTKVTATLPLALRLLEDGAWRLDDPIARFMPEFAELVPGEEEVRAKVSLRRLLTHTSGLPAWRAVGSGAESYADAVRRVCETPFAYQPGERVEYSCLGFILLGGAIERVTGLTLDAAFAEHVARPLGLGETTFGPVEGVPVAATEARADGGYWCGIVHDENAREAGGISGNAGLFGTAADLARYASAWLRPKAGFLSAATLKLATEYHTPGLNSARGLGWVVKADDHFSSAGDLFSPLSFGHTGFTGTSIWIDPQRGFFAILLTNRVHPSRENNGHIRLRPLFHNAVAAALS